MTKDDVYGIFLYGNGLNLELFDLNKDFENIFKDFNNWKTWTNSYKKNIPGIIYTSIDSEPSLNINQKWANSSLFYCILKNEKFVNKISKNIKKINMTKNFNKIEKLLFKYSEEIMQYDFTNKEYKDFSYDSDGNKIFATYKITFCDNKEFKVQRSYDKTWIYIKELDDSPITVLHKKEELVFVLKKYFINCIKLWIDKIKKNKTKNEQAIINLYNFLVKNNIVKVCTTNYDDLFLKIPIIQKRFSTKKIDFKSSTANKIIKKNSLLYMHGSFYWEFGKGFNFPLFFNH